MRRELISKLPGAASTEVPAGPDSEIARYGRAKDNLKKTAEKLAGEEASCWQASRC